VDILTLFITHTLTALVTHSEFHRVLGGAIHHNAQGSTFNKAILTHGVNVFVPIPEVAIDLTLEEFD
jgi:hypothetical protein